MDLRVFLKLDGSGFQQGLTTAKQGMARFAGGLKAQIAGAFTVGAIAAFSKKTITFSADLRHMADRLRLNVEYLQKIRLSAMAAGSSMEDLANFMGEVMRSREEAIRDPKGRDAASFQRMGITPSEVSSLSSQKFFERLIQAYGNGAAATLDNDLQEIGGRSARNLLAAFAAGIEANSKDIIPEDVINQFEELDTQFFLLKETMMTDLAPALAWLMGKVKDVADAVKLHWRVIGGLFTGGNAGAQKAADEFAQSLLARDDKARTLLEQRRALRRERENTGPGFVPGDPVEAAVKAPKLTKMTQPKTPGTGDALLSVGNFLGSSRGAIESIGRETNKILNQHTRHLAGIESKIERVGMDLGVPP